MADVRRVVSVSLGSSRRDKRTEIEIMGVPFVIERLGTDGDMARFAQMFRDLDGKVDALGVGGADLALVAGDRRYEFPEIARLVAGATRTPVVDGSGLKHTLERDAVRYLQESGEVDFRGSTTLLVSAVDRFGLAEALHDAGGRVIYGDLMFALGIPFPIRSYGQVKALGRLLLPVVTRLPFKWLYPTGDKQTQRTPKFPKVWAEAQIVAGDWHYIRRFAPDKLPGRTVITQTIRRDDLELLRSMEVARVITTTPTMGGESFATNVMEGVAVALLGKPSAQITESDYRDLLARLNWRPSVTNLA